MSVQLYWKGRLEDQNPIFNPELRVDKVLIRAHPGLPVKEQWPKAINRQVLYIDYLHWHDQVFLEPYRQSEFFKNRLPKYASELIFYATIAPWVYIVGKDEQVRKRKVPHLARFEGQWFDTKKINYFIRLCEWAHHAAAFELSTGLTLGEASPFFQEDKARILQDAIAEYKRRAAAHQELVKGDYPVEDDGLTDPQEDV